MKVKPGEVMSILDIVRGMADGLESKELIDGLTPRQAAEAVDLSIAYSPVVREVVDVERHQIPEPIKPRKDGLRWYTSDPRTQTWEWFDVEHMKLMRARFLLLRGWYYKRYKSFGYSDQQRIIGWYFEGGMWRPAEGSDLSRAMGLEPAAVGTNGAATR